MVEKSILIAENNATDQKIDLRMLFWAFYVFAKARPVFFKLNSEPFHFQDQFFEEENETRRDRNRVESNLVTTEQYDKLASEMRDMLMAVFSHITSLVIVRNTLELAPDFSRVALAVNGQGKRSGVFDRLQELAGDIGPDPRKNKIVLEEILVTLLSLSNHGPVPANYQQGMQENLRVNGRGLHEGHYLASALAGLFFYSHQDIAALDEPDSTILQARNLAEMRQTLKQQKALYKVGEIPQEEWGIFFDHYVKATKLIREVLALQGKERKGFEPKNYWPYLRYIFSYHVSQRVLLSLIDQLVSDHAVSKEALLARLRELNKNDASQIAPQQKRQDKVIVVYKA